MTLGSRLRLSLLATTAVTTALLAPATTSAPARADAPPMSFALPDGFQPEGIAVDGQFGYFGSRLDGDLYRADLRTGAGEVFSQGPGTPSVGLKVGPRDLVYVAGGTAGTVRIVSARTGEILRSFTPGTAGATFVNDVVLTQDAAWFTDSRAAQLYRVPLSRDGRLPSAGDVQTLPLTGEWVQAAPGVNGANGITATPDGRALLVVDSSTGGLFRVTLDGVAEQVDLGGYALTNGDGMLLENRTLYVVQNRLNKVAVLELDRAGLRGRLVTTLTSAAFDVPTTIARWRNGLYLPNARFSTPATPTTTYTVNRVERP